VFLFSLFFFFTGISHFKGFFAANYPYGVPCVSDASMRQWMEYVYMQQPALTNVTGVPVLIDVFDSNGNYRNIGTTTSDGSGNFSFTWTPDITRRLHCYRQLWGSESYYSSQAETEFHASAASAATPTVTSSAQGLATTTDLVLYITSGVVAIIIAIAIVGVALARRRP